MSRPVPFVFFQHIITIFGESPPYQAGKFRKDIQVAIRKLSGIGKKQVDLNILQQQ